LHYADIPLLQNFQKLLGSLLSSKMKAFIVIVLTFGLMAYSLAEAAVATGPDDDDIGTEVGPAVKADSTMLDKHVNSVASDSSSLKISVPWWLPFFSSMYLHSAV
jgi:hypothetical protein